MSMGIVDKKPIEDVAELLFDIVSDNASDEDLERIKQALKSLRSSGVFQRQHVAKMWADAMVEAVAYRRGGFDA